MSLFNRLILPVFSVLSKYYALTDNMIIFNHNIEYLLALISAMFGLSVPIMLQVIERVDQRYGSTRLAERLKSENTIKICVILLIFALITCTYAVFYNFPSLWDCWFMNNSADLVALVSCLALIVCFLCACRVILIYYNPDKLQDRILDSYWKAKTDKKKERDFLDWVDLTRILFSTSDRTPALKVYDTLGKEIYKALDTADEEGVSYPNYVVTGITSINENLCLMPRRPFSINNGNQILKDLIARPEKLSNDAYRLLWNNLQVQLFYDQEDWIYEYWGAAVQAYDLELMPLYEGMPAYDNPDKLISIMDVGKRNESRKRFKEFHITLCANIMREKRYDLLGKLTGYYRSMTPEYEYPLVPSSFAEIMDALQSIEDSPRLGFGVENYYPMRDMKGIVDGIVLGNVKQYLTFLFVRSFSNIGRLERAYAYYPETIGGLKRMDEDIDYMQRQLPSVLMNQELMNTLSFTDLKKTKEKMRVFIESIRGEITKREKIFKQTKPNDADLIKENLLEVKELVKQSLCDYSLFVKEVKNNANNKTYYLNGVSIYLYPNTAFQHDAGISYVNMAESVTDASIGRIQHGFASFFYLKEQKRFKINSEEVFAALDRLGIEDDFVIVAFDIYWDFYMHKGVDSLEKENGKYSYKGVPIICLHGGPTDIVSQTIYVMKKNDLPSLSYLAPVEEYIKQYELQLLDDDYKLYGSIVQLSRNKELLKKVDNMSEEEAKEESLFNVFINAKIAWRQSAPVVSIKLMYNMKDNGTADALENLVPFEKMFGSVFP